MDGFNNSTRAQYDTGNGYAKGGAAKVGKVMGEFAAGKLHSGSKKGPEVTSKKQAMAIAMSEANSSKKPVKKAHGGPAMSEMDRRMGEEDRTTGYVPKAAMPRKERMLRNARAAAPKREPVIVAKPPIAGIARTPVSAREPMVVAKKTTVTVAPKSDMMPKNANAVERLLAMKAGRPLKMGGSVKGSKVPVSEKATGKAEKQVGGMATSVRSTPEAEARDRGFIAARSVPMREMAGKPAYKKGGGIPC